MSLSTITGSVALLLPLAASALGIQVIIEGQNVTLMDVPQSAWYASYVHDAAQAGIVNGYKDDRGKLTGKFGPENSVTFAEALKIAVEGAGFNEGLYGSLVDAGTPSNHWASTYVAVAKGEHFPIMSTHFRLDQPATRAQVSALLTAAFSVKNTDLGPIDTRYKDVKTTTDFAADIEALSRDHIVNGDTDVKGQATGTFRPTEPINRAEVVKMVMLARASYGQPGNGKQPTTGSGSTANLVTYTDVGFSPAVIHVPMGTTVTFRNDSTEGLRVASNPHPTHTDYPGFDSDNTLNQGATYSFTFTRRGTFGYHNHLHPAMSATIVVD